MKGLYCVEGSFRSKFSTTTPLPQKTLPPPPPPPLQKNPKTKQNKKNIFFLKEEAKAN